MITYLLGVILNMFVLIYYQRDVYETLEGIFLFTIFILTWIPINVICLFKKDLKWVPIEHNKSTNVEALLNEK
jgi:hypothetical protein